MSGRRLLLLLAGTGLASVSLAAEGELQGARRCAQVQDSLERLVCYDRIFAPSPAPVSTLAPAVAPAPAIASAPAAAPAPAAAAGTTASAPSQEFGSDLLRRSDAERKSEEPPATMRAVVTELRETRPRLVRIALDNGQAWQQMEANSNFFIDIGDTVEINRLRLGGYRMARTGIRGGGWVRVVRVK